MEAEIKRWKITALVAIAFAVGSVVGQYIGTAKAANSVMKVQLDTSNCESNSEITSLASPIQTTGSLAGGVAINTAQYGKQMLWYFTQCK